VEHQDLHQVDGLLVVVLDQQNLQMGLIMELVALGVVVPQKLLELQTLVVVAVVDIGADSHLEKVQKLVVPVLLSLHILPK
jgi:hypothetical protein